MDFSHYAQFLGHLPIFNNMTPEEIADIARLFEVVPLKPGEELLKEGEASDCLFIVESGQAEIIKRADQGDEHQIALLQAPSIVGEMALIDPSPRSATVRITEPGQSYRVNKEDFDLLRTNNNQAAYKVLHNLGKMLCERLRETNSKVSEFFAHPDTSMEAMRSRQKALWESRVRAREQGKPT